MRCEQVRVAVSAQLDGAADRDGAVDAHLASCAGCRAWADDAAIITRLARTSAVAPPAPADDGLLDAVLAAAPGRGWAIAGRALRIALGVVGFAQFVLGVVQVTAFGMGTGSAGGMTSDHLWHESASWNIAIGAGYTWIALRGVRPAGVLPILTAFIGVLFLLSVNDLWTGEVTAGGLVTHLFVLAGYVILLILRHPGLDAPPGGRRWRIGAVGEDEDLDAEIRAVDRRAA